MTTPLFTCIHTSTANMFQQNFSRYVGLQNAA